VISHSPGGLARIADSILVMSAGALVEQGPPARLFRSPGHPYTAAVVEAAGGV
jgi:ABC-type dipeptide/oligopeptide/nickel transport system ATPase component